MDLLPGYLWFPCNVSIIVERSLLRLVHRRWCFPSCVFQWVYTLRLRYRGHCSGYWDDGRMPNALIFALVPHWDQCGKSSANYDVLPSWSFNFCISSQRRKQFKLLSLSLSLSLSQFIVVVVVLETVKIERGRTKEGRKEERKKRKKGKINKNPYRWLTADFFSELEGPS